MESCVLLIRLLPVRKNSTIWLFESIISSWCQAMSAHGYAKRTQ